MQAADYTWRSVTLAAYAAIAPALSRLAITHRFREAVADLSVMQTEIPIPVIKTRHQRFFYTLKSGLFVPFLLCGLIFMLFSYIHKFGWSHFLTLNFIYDITAIVIFLLTVSYLYGLWLLRCRPRGKIKLILGFILLFISFFVIECVLFPSGL